MSSHSDSLRKKLVRILCDQTVHSGADLAKLMTISRTAVWKHISHLRSCGLGIHSVKGHGYKLTQPVELLDQKKMQSRISARVRKKIKSVEVLFETDSTNQRLVEQLSDSSIHGRVCLAEFQSRGRGRRGKSWISPMAASLNLSLGWHFDIPPENIGCLSLITGLSVMRVFRKLRIKGAGLKWPNDIFAHDRKLGGILVEIRGENAGPVDVIIGIGINVSLAGEIWGVDQAATDLSALTDLLPSRNDLAGLMINELVLMLDHYPELDRKTALKEWRQYDCARGRQATITLPNKSCSDNVMGIDEQGLLIMRINNQIKKFTSGQVSLAVHN